MEKKGSWFSTVKKALRTQSKGKKGKKSKSKKNQPNENKLDVSSSSNSPVVDSPLYDLAPPSSTPSLIEETTQSQVHIDDIDRNEETSVVISATNTNDAYVSPARTETQFVDTTISSSEAEWNQEIAATKIQTAFRKYLAKHKDDQSTLSNTTLADVIIEPTIHMPIVKDETEHKDDQCTLSNTALTDVIIEPTIHTPIVKDEPKDETEHKDVIVDPTMHMPVVKDKPNDETEHKDDQFTLSNTALTDVIIDPKMHTPAVKDKPNDETEHKDDQSTLSNTALTDVIIDPTMHTPVIKDESNDETKHKDDQLTLSNTALTDAIIDSAMHMPFVKDEPNDEIAADKIQPVSEEYMGRKTSKALNGLRRIKSFVERQSMKGQTKVPKRMQSLSPTHHSQRGKLTSEENVSQKKLPKHEKRLNKLQIEEVWDGGQKSKEQRQAKINHNKEAAMRREKALAYAVSRQLAWKKSKNSKSSSSIMKEPNKPHFGRSYSEQWRISQPKEVKNAIEKDATNHGSMK